MARHCRTDRGAGHLSIGHRRAAGRGVADDDGLGFGEDEIA